MDYTTLGRTGLKVSVAGLGAGGFSRLGLRKGKTEADATHLVRVALDLGVNVLDTAEAYGTEPIIGAAIKGTPRDRLVLSTKVWMANDATLEVLPPERPVARIDEALRALGTDYIDVLYIHSVHPRNYEYARDVLTPALLREKEKGKFRFLGGTEFSSHDPEHTMFERAVDDDPWDAYMLGFNLMNHTARRKVFPMALKKGIGTMNMFTVRNVFSQPELLRANVRALVERGELPHEYRDLEEPLEFLIHDKGGAASVTDACYRFARHEPAVNVVLFGTSTEAHLRANIASLEAPPLPKADLEKIDALFGKLVGVAFDIPTPPPTTKAP